MRFCPAENACLKNGVQNNGQRGNMSYIVLARKYRPQSFGEVYAQEHVTEILHNAIQSKRIAHAYLFTGPRGVGKTSMARIMAKSLNCEKGPTVSPCNECNNCLEITSGTSTDVIEIDGASNTGVDDIRELQKELLYAPSKSRYKIYIIDEVHMLSKSAFNALLKTLEEPPENVVFIFATTEPQKVLATIISRCQRYDFKRIPIDSIVKRLREITTQEQIQIDGESLHLIARKADGGMRDALSLLDQVISYCQNDIVIKQVRNIFGLVPNQVYNELLRLIHSKDTNALLTQLQSIFEHGMDLQDLINNMMEYIRVVILRQLGLAPQEVTSEEYALYDEVGRLFSQNNLLYMMSGLMQARNEIKSSVNPYLIMEMLMIRLCKMDEMEDLGRLINKISKLGPGQPVIRQEKPVERPVPEAKSAPVRASEPPRQSAPPKIQKVKLSEETLAEVWPKIITRVKKASTVTGVALEQSKAVIEPGNKLVLRVKGNTNHAMVQARKDDIQKLLAEYFTPAVRWEPTLVESEAPTRVNIVRKSLDDLKKMDENIARYIEITDSRLLNGK
jgi:DNA polymerase-3 subunit gamma/tau